MIHLRKTEEISEIKNKDNSQIQQKKTEEEVKNNDFTYAYLTEKKNHIILEKNFVRFANTKAIL